MLPTNGKAGARVRPPAIGVVGARIHAVPAAHDVLAGLQRNPALVAEEGHAVLLPDPLLHPRVDDSGGHAWPAWRDGTSLGANRPHQVAGEAFRLRALLPLCLRVLPPIPLMDDDHVGDVLQLLVVESLVHAAGDGGARRCLGAQR